MTRSTIKTWQLLREYYEQYPKRKKQIEYACFHAGNISYQ